MDEVSEQILNLYENKLNVLENIEWTSYPNKYDDQYLCIKDSWNFPVTDLSDGTLTNNAGERKQFKHFYSWLGKRIYLALNLVRGLSNEELEEKVKNENK